MLQFGIQLSWVSLTMIYRFIPMMARLNRRNPSIGPIRGTQFLTQNHVPVG